LITDFIYKLPEKIKDMKSRNEDLIRMAEDLHPSQMAAGYQSNLSAYYYYYGAGAVGGGVGGGMGGGSSGSMIAAPGQGVGGGGGGMLHLQSMHKPVSSQVIAANENHDFEDLLNLV